MPPTKKTLNAALLAAQKDLNAVAKDSRNQHQRYDYVSAENMIGECRQVLHAHGLTLTAGNVELMPFGDTQYGEAVLVSHGMRLTYGDEVLELTRAWPAVPGKGRPLDKAVAGALTANLSYTLRDLLLYRVVMSLAWVWTTPTAHQHQHQHQHHAHQHHAHQHQHARQRQQAHRNRLPTW